MDIVLPLFIEVLKLIRLKVWKCQRLNTMVKVICLVLGIISIHGYRMMLLKCIMFILRRVPILFRLIFRQLILIWILLFLLLLVIHIMLGDQVQWQIHQLAVWVLMKILLLKFQHRDITEFVCGQTMIILQIIILTLKEPELGQVHIIIIGII